MPVFVHQRLKRRGWCLPAGIRFADAAQLPSDLVDWLERGAHPDEWRADRLEVDLVTRITESEPDILIIVEEPFGRARMPMRNLFDLAIHIDLPLGISLARRLLRDFVPESGGLGEQGTDRLRDYFSISMGAGLHTRRSTRWPARLVMWSWTA